MLAGVRVRRCGHTGCGLSVYEELLHIRLLFQLAQYNEWTLLFVDN